MTARERILDAGLRLWPDVSAHGIGRIIGMSHAGILYYFKNAADLRYSVARHAVACGDSRVIRFLIAERHDVVSAMPELDRMQHMISGAAPE